MTVYYYYQQSFAMYCAALEFSLAVMLCKVDTVRTCWYIVLLTDRFRYLLSHF